MTNKTNLSDLSKHAATCLLSAGLKQWPGLIRAAQLSEALALELNATIKEIGEQKTNEEFEKIKQAAYRQADSNVLFMIRELRKLRGDAPYIGLVGF